MKRLIITLTLLCLSFPALLAQPGKRYYLFPEFSVGQIDFFNGSKVSVKMNFDAAGQKIYYYDGETLMEMTNLPAIRTLQLCDRVFVVKNGLLCEVFDTESGPVLVNWNFKNVNRGSKGAMGLTTQGKVEVLTSFDFGHTTYTPSNMGKLEGNNYHAMEIWEQKNDNTSFISVEGSQYEVKRLKDLYAAFPDKAAEIKAFAKENHLTLTKVEDAFRMFEYVQSLYSE